MSEWGRKGGRGGAGPSGRVRKGWEARPAGASGHHHHVVSHEEGGGQEWLGQTPASFAPAAPSGFPNNCRKCATVSGTWTFGQVVGAGKQKGGKIGPAGLSPTPPPPHPRPEANDGDRFELLGRLVPALLGWPGARGGGQWSSSHNGGSYRFHFGRIFVLSHGLNMTLRLARGQVPGTRVALTQLAQEHCAGGDWGVNSGCPQWPAQGTPRAPAHLGDLSEKHGPGSPGAWPAPRASLSPEHPECCTGLAPPHCEPDCERLSQGSAHSRCSVIIC